MAAREEEDDRGVPSFKGNAEEIEGYRLRCLLLVKATKTDARNTVASKLLQKWKEKAAKKRSKVKKSSGRNSKSHR